MDYKKIKIELLLFFGLIIFILPSFNHQYDVECWKLWALAINNNGIGNAYNIGANYPPLIMYLLSGFDLFQGSDHFISKNINCFKIVPFIFDLLPVLTLIIFRKNYQLKKGYHFFLLFNISYLYNSIVWGQVDSIHTNLALTAIFISLRYPGLSIAFFVLALNMKLQAIIFLPVLLLCIAAKVGNIKQVFKLIVIGAGLQFIILIPFLYTGTVTKIWSVVSGSGAYYPFASMNAFNFWHLVLSSDPMTISDTLTFSGISYKLIGLILFFTLSAIALFPLLVKTIKTIVLKARPKEYLELAFLTAGIVTLLFFFVNTEMHERYAHPAIVFLFFYSLYRGKFQLYILVSAASLLNVEKVLNYYNMPHDILIFNTKLIACLFLMAIIIGILNSYRNYAIKKDIAFLRNKLNGAKSNDSVAAAQA